MRHPPEPTDEQIREHATTKWEGQTLHAARYPQMGGYVGRCWVAPNGNGGCFDVWIWHDGEFPFDGARSGAAPAFLHHCDPEQFIRFGQWVASLEGQPAPLDDRSAAGAVRKVRGVWVIEVAHCFHCKKLVLCPQHDECSCGAELYPVKKLVPLGVPRTLAEMKGS